jgi:hypothetical protein
MCIQQSHQFIHTLITFDSKNWLGTFIYVSNDGGDRRILLQDLEGIKVFVGAYH